MPTLEPEAVQLPATLLARARAWERSITRARAEALEAQADHDVDDDGIAQPQPDDLVYLTSVAGEALAQHLTRRGGGTNPGGRVEADGAGGGQHSRNNPTEARPVARWLARPGEWPAVLELELGAHHRHCLVVVEPSSMRPAADWPVRVRAADVVAWDVDAVVCAYVPRRTTLEGAAQAVAREGWLVGWLWADVVRTLATEAVEAHAGHPFAADYHVLRCDELSSPGSLLDGLFAGTGGG